jgi:SSS family solute:Na+ symporter
LETLLIYGSYIWSIVAVTFMWPIYGGLYWKKATKEGAIFSSVGGIIAVVTAYTITHYGSFRTEIHRFLPSILISLVIFCAVSMLTYKRRHKR